MASSVESKSTPIADGGWYYNPEIDAADFEQFTAAQLWELEAEHDYDFAEHPALIDQADIEGLARRVAGEEGIDSYDAARDAIRAHVDQIADDADLYNAATNVLSTAGVEVVMAAVAASYAQGMHGTVASQLLEDIAAENAAGERHTAQAAEHFEQRDELVRAAMKTELPRAAIAAAAGVSEGRLYQIRDGRR